MQVCGSYSDCFGRHLKNLDVGSLSDPYVVLNIIDPKTKSTVEIGRTEYIKYSPFFLN